MRFRSVWQGGWTPEKMGEMDEMGRRLEEAGPPEKMGEMDEMGATVKGDDKQTRRRRGPHYGPPQKRNTDATPTQRQGGLLSMPPLQTQRRRNASQRRRNADATPGVMYSTNHPAAQRRRVAAPPRSSEGAIRRRRVAAPPQRRPTHTQRRGWVHQAYPSQTQRRRNPNATPTQRQGVSYSANHPRSATPTSRSLPQL